MAVIQVNNVYKNFKVFYDKGQTFKEKLLFRNRNYYEDRWVLEGVSFSVEKGEVVGLIGHKKKKKSTLLKLMTKIMYPDKGDIRMGGRVSSLLELGAGFHPDMRGKENIYTNASIFGLSKKEIDDRLDEIIAFSELEEYINNPVRTYSSGMYMRLAFSVAINVDADILLIDEILAVGDANFQAKCLEKLNELKKLGVTIVLVTHDMTTVEKFCTKAIWLNDGRIMSGGDPVKTAADYLMHMARKKYDGVEPLPPPEEEETRDTVILEEAEEVTEEQKMSIDQSENRFGLRYVEITHAEILDAEGRPTNVLKAGEPAGIAISYKRNKTLSGYVFGFAFWTLDGVAITGSNTQLDGVEIKQLTKKGKVVLRFHSIPLTHGKYVLQVAVVDQNGVPMDFYRAYSHFDVVSDDRSVGLVTVGRVWEVM